MLGTILSIEHLLQLAPISYDSYCSSGKIGHNLETKEALDLYNVNTINDNIVFKQRGASKKDYYFLLPGIFHKKDRAGPGRRHYCKSFSSVLFRENTISSMNHHEPPL